MLTRPFCKAQLTHANTRLRRRWLRDPQTISISALSRSDQAMRTCVSCSSSSGDHSYIFSQVSDRDFPIKMALKRREWKTPSYVVLVFLITPQYSYVSPLSPLELLLLEQVMPPAGRARVGWTEGWTGLKVRKVTHFTQVFSIRSKLSQTPRFGWYAGRSLCGRKGVQLGVR